MSSVRGAIGFRVAILAVACALIPATSSSVFSAPMAPNESTITADMVNLATIVDSSTVGILPIQPLCVLVLKLLDVNSPTTASSVPGAEAGETITAYSKDLALATAKGMRLAGQLTYRGNVRGGSFWVFATSTSMPEVR